MLRYLLPIFLVAVTACNTMNKRHEEDVSDIKSTKYSVRRIGIYPATPEIQKDKDYEYAVRTLYQQLASETVKMPQNGQPIDLIVILNELQFSVNPALIMLIGDSYQLSGTVQLKDMSTQQIIDEKEISSAGSGRGGVAGIVGDAMSTHEESIESALSGFADSALYFAYPERSAWAW